MIKVLVVDDDHLMRVGLIEILGADPTITVVGHADSGTRAIELARLTLPDVTLMDVRMPNGDGIAATRAITSELAGTRVIVLTTFDQDDYVFDALEAGASGFLLKRARPEELLEAIHVVASGEAVLSPAVTRRVIDQLGPRRGVDTPSEITGLTAREREVLDQIAAGLSNAQISAALCIEESTVRTHIKHLFRKLQLRDRVHAVIYAYEHGLGRAAAPRAD